MARHEFEPVVFHSTIGSHPPVLRIEPGDTVVTATVDAAGRDARGHLVATPGNPQTGPFFISGAQPGDMLEVRFDRIWPNRDRAVASASIAPGVLEPGYLQDQPAAPELAIAEWRGRDADLQRRGVRRSGPPDEPPSEGGGSSPGLIPLQNAGAPCSVTAAPRASRRSRSWRTRRAGGPPWCSANGCDQLTKPMRS